MRHCVASDWFSDEGGDNGDNGNNGDDEREEGEEDAHHSQDIEQADTDDDAEGAWHDQDAGTVGEEDTLLTPRVRLPEPSLPPASAEPAERSDESPHGHQDTSQDTSLDTNPAFLASLGSSVSSDASDAWHYHGHSGTLGPLPGGFYKEHPRREEATPPPRLVPPPAAGDGDAGDDREDMPPDTLRDAGGDDSGDTDAPDATDAATPQRNAPPPVFLTAPLPPLEFPRGGMPPDVQRLWEESARGRATRHTPPPSVAGPLPHPVSQRPSSPPHSSLPHSSAQQLPLHSPHHPQQYPQYSHYPPTRTTTLHGPRRAAVISEPRLTAVAARTGGGGWDDIPPGGAGALWTQITERKEAQMATLIDTSRPTLTAAEPPNLANLCHYTRDARSGGYGLTLRLQPGLPAHTLALLYPVRREIYLSERLFPPMARSQLQYALQYPAHLRGVPGAPSGAISGWDYFLNQLPTLRFVVGTLWTLWYAFDEILAFTHDVALSDLRAGRIARASAWNITMPFSVAFAPVRLDRRDRLTNAKSWEPIHARYYTALWQNACRLLANHEQIRAQTAEYFGIPVESVPPIGADLRGLVYGCPPPSLGIRYPNAHDRAIASWEAYIGYIAQRSIVPQAMVRSRLDLRPDGSERTLETPQDLIGMTNELMDSPVGVSELSRWREQVASDFRAPVEHTVLWLAEPSMWMPGVPQHHNAVDN